MNELDEIMSGAGDTVSASTETTTTDAPAPVEPAGGPIRDEAGRFASQQQPEEGAGAATTDQPAHETTTDANGVPVAALKAEREKARAAKDEAEALRREVAELRGMVTAQRQTAQPQQRQEEQTPVDLFSDPENYFASKLTPLEQQLRNQAEKISERFAIREHGAETVAAAKAAIEAVAGTYEGQAVVQKLIRSDDPYEELVKWHKQQQTMAKVGNDPDAWLQAELEKRMADPTFQAQVLERARAGASNPVPGRTAAPITNLPPSLSRMPGGANAAADNDMSDGAIFSHAIR